MGDRGLTGERVCVCLFVCLFVCVCVCVCVCVYLSIYQQHYHLANNDYIMGNIEVFCGSLWSLK